MQIFSNIPIWIVKNISVYVGMLIIYLGGRIIYTSSGESQRKEITSNFLPNARLILLNWVFSNEPVLVLG